MPKVDYTKKKEKKEAPVGKKHCPSCEKHLNLVHFYNSTSKLHSDAKIPYCKDCLKKMIVDDEGYINDELLKKTLRTIDRPFVYRIWENSLNESNKRRKEPFGMYMKNISLSHRDLTWDESIFDDADERQLAEEANESEYPEYKKPKSVRLTKEELDRLEEKWGSGYQKEELLAFERKYEDLKNNYPEKTAMHTESLKTYVRYKTKEEFATAKNAIQDAKQWGDLAFKAATNAKINPSQLSKADLSDGLSTFSELSQAVEAEVNVIRILPEFKSQPNDVIDFNLWCYANYVRHLKGLPECSYEEIYEFYDRNVENYIKQYGDPNGIFEQDNTKKNREQVKTFIKDV